MIIWKGIDLKTKGIINDNIPKIVRAKKNIETYEVYGRNGFLSIDNDTYNSFNVSLECHIADNANLDEVAKLLSGYGTLSFDGLRQTTAIVSSHIELDTIRNSGFKKFMLNFQCNPIFEDVVQTTRDYTNSFSPWDDYYRFLIEGSFYYKVEPEELEIEISADTDFYFNGRKFSLKSGHYFLNCKMKEIVDNDGDNASSKMSGDFPYLDTSGSNIIRSSTLPTTFKMKYRKPYLVG